MSPPPTVRARLLTAAALVAAAALPYLNALGAGFTFDDGGMIQRNPLVTAPAMPVWALLTTPYEPGSLYRPVTFFTFWINQRSAPGEALWFHLLNIVLHVGATGLVFACARTVLRPAAAFFAAALFAVHPVHTEAVTSIVGRAELLAGAGVLGALACFLRAERRRPGRTWWLGFGAAAATVGMLSKESAAVCLPLLMLLRAARSRGSLRARAAAVGRSPACWIAAALTAGYLGIRWALFGGLTLPAPPEWLDNPLAYTSLPVRLGTAIVVLADYVRLLVLPLRLSADYSFAAVPPVSTALDPRLLWSGLLICSCAALAWKARHHLSLVPVGMVFFLAALGLTANVLFPIGTIKAERLLYLPSVGFCLAVAATVQHLRRRHPRLIASASVAVIALLAARTWVRNADWHSNLTLFRTTVATSPHSAKAHHNLAVALDGAGQYADAALSFRQALRLYPAYDQAAFGIGRMYEIRGIATGALHWYEETLRLNPHYVPAHLNRGAMLYNRGDVTSAEAAFRAGLAVDPDDPKLLTGLGLSRLAQGDPEQAAAVLRRATELDATNTETLRALQLALQARKAAPGGES